MFGRKTLLAALLVGFAVLGWTVTAHAQGWRTAATVSIGADQTVDETVYAAGQTVDIAGTVNGDVICAGQSVTISGTVNGDVICAGQSVEVTGTINGSVRIIGQSVNLGAVVDRNASVAGQNITLSAGAQVKGDLSVAGQNATVDGSVGRDLAAGAATVAVNGKVGRNVSVADGTLNFGNSAAVAGSVTYTSDNNLSRQPGAVIVGSVTRHIPVRHAPVHRELFAGVWFALYFFVALMVLALALVLLFPQALQSVSEVAVLSPWKTGLIGVGVSIVVPAVVIALLVTLVGIPLALLVVIGWIFAIFISWPLAAYYLGRRLLQSRTKNPVLFMLLGEAILLIIYFVPFLGGLITLLAMWFGLGMIVRQWRRLPRPAYSVGMKTK